MVGNRIKITIVTYGNYPFGGASANLLRLLAKGLIENGADLNVVLPVGYFFGGHPIKNKKVDIYEGVKYQYLGYVNHPKNIIGKLFDLALGFFLPMKYFLTIQTKPDIIVLYNISISTILPFLFIRNFIKNKLVLVLPEFYERPKVFFLNFRLIKWYDFYIAIKYFAIKANSIIVLSTYLKNYIVKRQNNFKQILIVPNLVDPGLFDNINVIPSDSKIFTIGYVGTPTKKDGIDDLLGSFALLTHKYDNVRLLIIGDITNGKSIIPSLILKTELLNIKEKVSFTGLVNYQQVPRLLSACHILVLTRPNGIFAEAGFPTKLGEYFATKKPVLMTNVGDVSNYFTNGNELVIVEAENIDCIMKGFEKIILDMENSKLMGIRGYNWMMENLHYQIVTNRIYNFFSYILSK